MIVRQIVSFILLLITLQTSGYSYHSVPAYDLQPLFKLQENGPWLGSDVFTSIQINSSNYLWLLGDTLTGTIINTQRVITAMPRNAIAMMVKEDKKPPSPLDFHIPIDPNIKNIAFFIPKNTSNWFWPVSGCKIKDKLYLFAYYVYPNGTGSFGFAFHGSVVIEILKPLDDPDNWVYNYTQIPNTDSENLWGSAAILIDNFLYLLGSHKSDAVLSRISTNDVIGNNWDSLEKWSYNGNSSSDNPSWNINPKGELVSLFSSIPETTIQYHPFVNKYFVLNIPFFGTNIYISWSEKLTGPWSSWEKIYEIPYPWNDTQGGIFCYAPKSHPQFIKKNNEIILTFASNTLNPIDLVTKLQIYDPQAISVFIFNN